MRISDWSSDVCASDLSWRQPENAALEAAVSRSFTLGAAVHGFPAFGIIVAQRAIGVTALVIGEQVRKADGDLGPFAIFLIPAALNAQYAGHCHVAGSVEFNPAMAGGRSEEHTSELQSLIRISYAVFCLKKTHSST